MPNPLVKPISHGAAKWKDRAGSASGTYKTGVQSTPKSWSAAATAAKGAWQSGVTQAASNDRYAKGVGAAGDQTWKDAAATKGPDRYASGVSYAEPKYARQAAPYYEAIGRIDLPPRGAKGADANYGRVAPIGKALHQLRMSR